MFYALAAASLAIASLIALSVPEKPLPGAGATWGEQFAALGRIFSQPLFWRIALPFVVTHGAYQALQGLWLGPWLTDVAGLDRGGRGAAAARVRAGAYAVGSVAFGSFADRLAARGIARLALYKCGLVVSLAAFLCIALDLALPRAGAAHGVRLHRDVGRARLRAYHAEVPGRRCRGG